MAGPASPRGAIRSGVHDQLQAMPVRVAELDATWYTMWSTLFASIIRRSWVYRRLDYGAAVGHGAQPAHCLSAASAMPIKAAADNQLPLR